MGTGRHTCGAGITWLYLSYTYTGCKQKDRYCSHPSKGMPAQNINRPTLRQNHVLKLATHGHTKAH